jgi:hypothetical protein
MNTLKAIVHEIVVPTGKHGPYAVATAEGLTGSVTFSLDPSVWKESEWPERGMEVLLGKLRKKRAGWRAKEGRFLKPSDEQLQQQAKSNGIQFLYPISTQYPFDYVCQQIVLELEKRNWEVPGITVEFNEYGTGDDKYRMAYDIRGEQFRLHFCRGQRPLSGGRLNDIAAVTELITPYGQINVHEDESGPTFYLYTGGNWERDREHFMHSTKVNSRLRNEPKMYLQYSGSASIDGGYTYSGQRSKYLVHTNDIGRQYDPDEFEPKWFYTADTMKDFQLYFENVLSGILLEPIPKERIDKFIPPPFVAFPESIGPLFCFGEYDDAKRIIQGKKDPSELEPSERYGLIGNGYRLVPLGVPNKGTFPEIAYEGFLWCGIGKVIHDTAIDSLMVPGHSRYSDREQFVVCVTPKSAEGIYIADHAVWEKRRKEIIEATTNERDRFTNDEVSDFTRARGATIIPIAEYKGGYEQPIVLVHRELSFNEVAIVSGPHKDRFGR